MIPSSEEGRAIWLRLQNLWVFPAVSVIEQAPDPATPELAQLRLEVRGLLCDL